MMKKKRRREGKTDYEKRLKLLSSGLPRLVIRKTNRYIIAEIVKSKEAQDFVVAYANSKELMKYGWPSSAVGSLKNLCSAYLTGFLLAKKLKLEKEKKGKKEKIEKVILDIGLHPSTKGSRIYACVAGFIDGGIEVPVSPEVLPKKEEIEKRKNFYEIENIKNSIEKNYRKNE